MVKAPGATSPPYTEAQATAWLAWLARSMQQQGQTLFLIEQLQPSWLCSRRQRRVYILVSRLIRDGIPGIFLGVVLGTLVGPRMLAVGTLAGLVAGLLDAFIDFSRLEGRRWWQPIRRLSDEQQGMVYALLVGFVGASLYAFVYAVRIGLLDALFFIVVPTLILSIVYGQSQGSRLNRDSYRNDIRVVETLRWSWRGARRGAITGLLSGPLFLLLLGLTLDRRTLPSWGTGTWVLVVLAVAAMSAVLFGTVGSLQPGILELKTAPNQGTKLSLRNAVFAGLRLAVVLASAGELIFRLIGKPGYGLMVTPTTASFAAMAFGGMDVIEHYTLRAILYLKGYAPWDYARFLDFAANELGFLQKVGGGYMFIHRLLLEHFADMAEDCAAHPLPAPLDAPAIAASAVTQ